MASEKKTKTDQAERLKEGYIPPPPRSERPKPPPEPPEPPEKDIPLRK